MNDARLRYNSLGFLEVVTPPSSEELKAYYADRYYQTEQGSYRGSYSDEEIQFRNLKIAQKASLAASLRGHNIPGCFLDVGCGEGFALAWFAENGWSVAGIDHSTAGLQAMNPELLSKVESGDLFDLLDQRINEAQRYELIWLSNVLEHVVDPVKLLSSIRRLIAPEGILVVTVPNDGSTYQENLFEHGDIPNRFWIAIPDHLAYFTRESLIRTVEATGWLCREIIADFPIDFFLLHPGSNYVTDQINGPAAHQARIRMELILGDHSHDKVNHFYAAMAQVGLGRCLTAFLSAE
jgi:2-polyprenyl-3-methyl-5-hydroxy-6-metoxy-1,4-benzoquinol methylase